MRITLKVMESLTYVCNDAKRLLELNGSLNSLLEEFKRDLPHDQHLIVRTSVATRALKAKRKYARIKRSLQCSQLGAAKKRGRKKASKFRKRVGSRADRLRKVRYFYIIIDIVIFYNRRTSCEMTIHHHKHFPTYHLHIPCWRMILSVHMVLRQVHQGLLPTLHVEQASLE